MGKTRHDSPDSPDPRIVVSKRRRYDSESDDEKVASNDEKASSSSEEDSNQLSKKEKKRASSKKEKKKKKKLKKLKKKIKELERRNKEKKKKKLEKMSTAALVSGDDLVPQEEQRGEVGGEDTGKSEGLQETKSEDSDTGSIPTSSIAASKKKDFFARLAEEEADKGTIGTVHATGKAREEALASKQASQKPNNNDWECHKCGRINYRLNTACDKCKAMKRMAHNFNFK
mmetsp:Transcript_43327/g.74823  ORF Transcript_43327/g.74823 Transcript_43327/m.74823 type:complete len:229 (+) Transcript_43327:70-756(+)